ncbi:MAG: glycosyltransferase family 4 protein [Burkholderiaceae bacterium]
MTPAPRAHSDRRLAISNHALRHGGGFERYAMTLVRGLHESGVRAVFIAKSFDTSLPEHDWVDPIRLGVTGVPGKLRDLFFDWRIGRIKRRLGAALGPLIACNQTRWADIAVCGGTHPGYLAAMGQSTRTSDRWKIALERAHFESARVIVAHSGRMRDEIVRHYGITSDKIVLLYPPTDTERFSPVDKTRRTRLRDELGLSDDRAVFLLASTGHKRKGLDVLAHFFAGTDLPVTLVVAGRPPPRGLPNVRYLGYRTDIEDVYRAVDFTVMASAYEPFGLVGIESVLCGTPVLLADSIGCAELIREPAQLSFSLGDPASLGRTVGLAVQRWRGGAHRLEAPGRLLAYDPRVAPHVDALLAMAESMAPRH